MTYQASKVLNLLGYKRKHFMWPNDPLTKVFIALSNTKHNYLVYDLVYMFCLIIVSGGIGGIVMFQVFS